MKKYKWLLPLVAFSVALICIRVAWTRSLEYCFIAWNIFLAFLPLYFSSLAYKTNSNIKRIIYSLTWLLFFPNSMYIITDLFHLRQRSYVPLWFDLLVLFSSALNGIIAGFISLNNIEKTYAAQLKNSYRNVIVFFIMLLCGYGIYLGRFERWNSWDIITQPYLLLYNIAYDVTHPLAETNTWALSMFFGTWLYLLYRYAQKTKAG